MRFPGSGGGDGAGMIYASGVVLGWCLLWGSCTSGSCRAGRAAHEAHSQGADGRRFSRLLRAVRPHPHPGPCNGHLGVGLREQRLHI